MARTVNERADTLPALAEVFREHGFEGASLSLITAATGLGKGSLYHFFPGGKEEMATAVLGHIDQWFEVNVYEPLRQSNDPFEGIEKMFHAVDTYFHSGGRVCLVGAFALSDVRDHFAAQLHSYFARWIIALADTLMRSGQRSEIAHDKAEAVVLCIQGAIVLARALNHPATFKRALARMSAELLQG